MVNTPALVAGPNGNSYNDVKGVCEDEGKQWRCDNDLKRLNNLVIGAAPHAYINWNNICCTEGGKSPLIEECESRQQACRDEENCTWNFPQGSCSSISSIIETFLEENEEGEPGGWNNFKKNTTGSEDTEVAGAGFCLPGTTATATPPQPKCCNKGDSSCESPLDQAVEEAKEICEQTQEQALQCCHEPESCLPGGNFTASLVSAGGMYHAARGDSMRENCKKLKQSFAGYASVNALMGQTCRGKARACQEDCGEAAEEIKTTLQETCLDNPVQKCTQGLYDKYQAEYEQLKKIPGQCQRTSRESNRQHQAMADNIAKLWHTAQTCKTELSAKEMNDKKPKASACTRAVNQPA